MPLGCGLIAAAEGLMQFFIFHPYRQGSAFGPDFEAGRKKGEVRT